MVSDLAQGLCTTWADSGLDAKFKAYWLNGGNEFYSLHDQQAVASQPFPYCVFEQQAGNTVTRMSRIRGQTSGRMEQRQIPLEFTIHARSVGQETAKEIASYLAEEVIKVFGGHPEEVPAVIGLTHGTVLRVQYETHFGTREGDQEYAWVVRYQFLIDIPVAA